MNTYQETITKFKGKKILVIGDLMLDKYIWGKVERISPEAPVPIVTVTKESYAPGGAANTAANITALGGEAHMVGICGADEAKTILIRELKARNIKVDGIIEHRNKPTTQKVRVIGQSQQLLRVDYEKNEEMHETFNAQVVAQIKEMIPQMNVVVVSDYAKGMITKQLMQMLIGECNARGIPLVVDPKPKHAKFYAGAYLLTPNTLEALGMSGVEGDDNESILSAAKKIKEELNTNVLITRGEKGMFLYDKNHQTLSIPTKAQEVYDVSGAGDTVVATLALAIAAGAPLNEAAWLANHAAGIKVGKLGTSTVSHEELYEAVGKDTLV